MKTLTDAEITRAYKEIKKHDYRCGNCYYFRPSADVVFGHLVEGICLQDSWDSLAYSDDNACASFKLTH